MKRNDSFLMPDYYIHFMCKMGECRHACCEGWPVSISRDDYFRLLGLECDADLRRRIDCGAHILDHATPERYAQITHKYDGQCHMRMEDGRCAIQATLGEDLLPEVCRLYPRALRTTGHNECSCTASCERVIEMLFFRKEPLSLIEREIEYTPLRNGTNTVFDETSGNEQEFRLQLIKIIQDRSLPLNRRIINLGKELKVETKADNSECPIDTMRQIVSILDEKSVSLCDYGVSILDQITSIDKYQVLKAVFESCYPDWQSGIENVIVNHLFYSRFPFGDEGMSFKDEFYALCLIYALIRFLCIGAVGVSDGDEYLTDVLAAAFRMIEHMPFHKYASALMHGLGITDDNLISLLSI